MPPKIKEFAIYANIILVVIMTVTFFVTRRDISESKLKDKASILYVDEQDKGIKEDIREDKEEHQKQHDVTNDLLKSMDSKIDILLTAK